MIERCVGTCPSCRTGILVEEMSLNGDQRVRCKSCQPTLAVSGAAARFEFTVSGPSAACARCGRELVAGLALRVGQSVRLRCEACGFTSEFAHPSVATPPA
jgi:predicted Zn finger-like uncharacterized protein